VLYVSTYLSTAIHSHFTHTIHGSTCQHLIETITWWQGDWWRISTSRNGAVVKGETASTDMKPSTILNQSGLTANPQGPGCTPPPSNASHLVTKCTCGANYWKCQGSVSWLHDLHNKQYQRSAYSDRGHMTFDPTRLDGLFLNTWGLAKWNLLHKDLPQSTRLTVFQAAYKELCFPPCRWILYWLYSVQYLAIAVVTTLVRVRAENVAYKYTHGFPHSRCQQNG